MIAIIIINFPLLQILQETTRARQGDVLCSYFFHQNLEQSSHQFQA